MLFVEDRLTGVIDFYYACVDAWLYDLAVTLNDWATEPDGRPNPVRWQSLVLAYRGCRELNDAEHAAWSLTLRAAAFRFYLSRLYDWHFPRAGDVVHLKDPASTAACSNGTGLTRRRGSRRRGQSRIEIKTFPGPS